jgi:uncharacterized repeat protein (TIGR03803 family)
MTSPMERVWARMGTTAAKVAKRKTFISVAEAQRAILTMCHLERTASPPPDALEYWASELVRMSQAELPDVGESARKRFNNGTLYGATYSGGTRRHNYGTVFALTP